MPDIAPPSYASLFARLTRFNRQSGTHEEQGAGTCFEVQGPNGTYLVTNWHVVTGTNPLTGVQGAQYLPDSIEVDFHTEDFEVAATHRYPLYDDDGRPRWFVHPERGSGVDVVALEYAFGGGYQIAGTGPAIRSQPYQLESGRPAPRLEPTTELSLIGFPFGERSTGTLGIWSRATVASEPDLDYRGDPIFLIDSRSRKGQSGSPVIAYRPQGTMSPLAGGNTVMFSGGVWDLLGVYSGRINNESDIGRVWKKQVIGEIIAGQTRDTFKFF